MAISLQQNDDRNIDLSTRNEDLDLRREYVRVLQLMKVKRQKQAWQLFACTMLLSALIGCTI